LLDAMRRPYTRAYYSRLVDRIRSAIPHASIGSDIIVGFPGETETDFAIMESYLSASPLTHLHVFPYSDRPGTAATMLDGKVHGSIVRDRAARVREIGRHLNRRFNRSQDGAVRPALTIEDGSTVITDNYLRVRIPPGLTRNAEVHVRVRAAGDDLVGELAEATA
jgi:threonylcarbamoyladenosine tRNA methylthiotransferase MtaB